MNLGIGLMSGWDSLKDPFKVVGDASPIKSAFGQLALSLSAAAGTIGIAALARKAGASKAEQARLVSGETGRTFLTGPPQPEEGPAPTTPTSGLSKPAATFVYLVIVGLLAFAGIRFLIKKVRK